MIETSNWDWFAEKNYSGNHFYYSDKKFLQYFCKTKNKYETDKALLLLKKLKESTEKIHSAELMSDTASSGIRLYLLFGYAENYGYYALKDLDRGHYSVPYGLPSENIDTAVMMILKCIITYTALEFEMINHDELKEDFDIRFVNYDNLKYKPCLYYAEYSLNVWKVIFDGTIPKEIIKYYETYLNDVSSIKLTPYMWEYNVKEFKFELVAKTD